VVEENRRAKAEPTQGNPEQPLQSIQIRVHCSSK